ncbi:hypothetical protein RSAG8_06359, partial [Rhizoctonia solani AG-8 WAC10335]
MLLNSDDLELAIQNMIRSPEIETPLAFSSHVARVVQVQSQRAAQGLDCDSIIGWGASDGQPLVSLEQAKALVEILWDDRANMLKALTSTYTPALSGLLFLLWRYIYLDAWKEILESFAKNDLLDLVATALFRLDPNADERTPDFGMNYNFLKSLQSAFDKIGSSHTPALLEECFRGYALDWLKVQHQINIRGMCMELHGSRNEASQRRKRHYEMCNGVWDTIARTLRQKDNIERARRSWTGCMFLRCQDPIGIDRKGAAYACPKCRAVPYCSVRCQAGDWVLGGERDPHRATCQQFADVFNPSDVVASFADLMRLL